MDGGAFWDGVGAALVGSMASLLVALLVLFVTRGNERRLLREQAALEASSRLLDQELSLATLIEFPLARGDVQYRDWLKELLPMVSAFRRAVALDASLLSDARLREPIVVLADYLADGFVYDLGIAEGQHPKGGEAKLLALDDVKSYCHAEVMKSIRALSAFRAHYNKPWRPTLRLQRTLQEQRRGVWH